MLIPLLRLTRPGHALLMPWPFLLTVYYARSGAIRWPSDVFAALAMLVVIAGGYVLNDVCDVGYDRRDGRSRPIAAGEAPRMAAGVFGGTLMVAGCVLAAATAGRAFFWALAGLAAAYAVYDLVSKRIGIFKDVYVAAMMACLYPLAAAQAEGGSGPHGATLPLFALWLFLAALAYEILTDIRDRKSDRAGGGGPIRIQKHPRYWMQVANGVLVVAGVVLVVPAFVGCRWVYLSLVPILAGIPWILSIVARRVRAKIFWIFLEFVGVGLACTADVVIGGMGGAAYDGSSG
jgi:4-hydroxybenzoate polyprenyltransferase